MPTGKGKNSQTLKILAFLKSAYQKLSGCYVPQKKA